ncbi:MAG TPA: hypothetical protein VMH05_22165 [Bryobacteraceae bacterium]|nr:hypothetical protein [Bryobacteraceae bacterium]
MKRTVGGALQLADHLTVTGWLVAAMVATGSAAEQESKRQVKVLTVCEVLGGMQRFAGTAVAVVGRMERSVSIEDHYEFLSQDRCERPVVTHGHIWPDKIQIWANREEGMPKPPSDRPKLKVPVVARKLTAVRATTDLGTHQEPRFKVEGHSLIYTQTAAVPNQWAVVYGRIATAPNLNQDCGADGCGGDDAPLAILAEPYNVHMLREDGTLLEQKQ